MTDDRHRPWSRTKDTPEAEDVEIVEAERVWRFAEVARLSTLEEQLTVMNGQPVAPLTEDELKAMQDAAEWFGSRCRATGQQFPPDPLRSILGAALYVWTPSRALDAAEAPHTEHRPTDGDEGMDKDAAQAWGPHHVLMMGALEKHCHENHVPLDDIAVVFDSLAKSAGPRVARDAFIAFALQQAELFARERTRGHDPA